MLMGKFDEKSVEYVQKIFSKGISLIGFSHEDYIKHHSHHLLSAFQDNITRNSESRKRKADKKS